MHDLDDRAVDQTALGLVRLVSGCGRTRFIRHPTWTGYSPTPYCRDSNPGSGFPATLHSHLHVTIHSSMIVVSSYQRMRVWPSAVFPTIHLPSALFEFNMTRSHHRSSLMPGVREGPISIRSRSLTAVRAIKTPCCASLPKLGLHQFSEVS